MSKLQNFGIDQQHTSPQEQAIYSLALLYNVISQDISNFLKQYKLTVGKLNVLIAIKHHAPAEGITQVEISQHLIVTPSNMTSMIDKLERDGLVKRYDHPTDRRVNLTKITRKGSRLLDQLWPEYTKLLKHQMSGLSQLQHRNISKLLVKWFEART